MFWLGWAIFAVVALSIVPGAVALKYKRLRTPAADPPPGELPKVSVIVPARNEEIQIRNALSALLKTEGIEIEVVAVDDRSTDATGSIMDDVGATDPRMKVIHIDALPAGWLGKNHAMHAGAQVAEGQLLLFTDGDIIFEPRALEAAVRHFTTCRLQHLCLLPRMIPGSALESVAITFFGLAFATGLQLHLVRTKWPLSYVGVGAFNLIDAEFYRSVGGHKPIALDVLDDVKLGKMVKRNGGRSDFQRADEWLSVRWQPSLWGIVTGLEKNGFASLNYSLVQISIVTLIFVLTLVLPFVLPVVLPLSIVSGFLATAILWHVVFAWLVIDLPGGWKLIPLFLAGPWIMAFANWRSMVITLKHGGVKWRDSFYPLDQLRKSIY